MWVGAFRKFDHSSQETSSAIEGYHTSIKATLGTDKVLLRGRRVDCLVFMLTQKVLATAWDRVVSKLCGFQSNTKQEKVKRSEMSVSLMPSLVQEDLPNLSQAQQRSQPAGGFAL